MPELQTKDPRITTEQALDAAVFASSKSPCQSKRGVAIWDRKGLLSLGWNHQPAPFICDGSDLCKSKCGHTAIHAEQHAILLAAKRRLKGAELLHIKTVNGEAVPSMYPSCIQCSKLILACGIKTVYLLHHFGLTAYSAAEFHRKTCEDWHMIQLIHPGKPEKEQQNA